VKGMRLDRHAEHRQNRFGGGHAGEVRCAAGARNNDLDAAFFGACGILEEQIGRAVRRDDARLERDVQLFQRLRCVTHCFPIRL